MINNELKSLIEKGLLDEAECNFMTYATVDKHVEDDQEPLPEIIEDPKEKESKTSDLIYITDFDKLEQAYKVYCEEESTNEDSGGES